MWMHDGWVDARRGSEPGSVGPWVDVGLQTVERSPLDPTTHACLCCLCCPCRPGTPAPAPAPSPAPSLSAYVIGPSIWAGSVVIGGRAWGVRPAANQSDAFDSAASAKGPGKTRAGATGSLRRRDDTTTLPAHADTAQKHTSRGPHSRLTACNQLPACSPLSQSQSQSQSRIRLLRLRDDDSWGGLFSASSAAASAGLSVSVSVREHGVLSCVGLLGTHVVMNYPHCMLPDLVSPRTWLQQSGWRHGRQPSPPRGGPLRSPR